MILARLLILHWKFFTSFNNNLLEVKVNKKEG